MTQTLRIHDKDYEVIEFNKRITNKSISTTGLRFAHGYLAIADAYRIYSTKSGEPLLKCRFNTLDECIKFTEILEKVYWDYWELWDAYPLADIISWCKYSVDDGVRLFELCEIIDNLEVVTNKEIKDAITKAEEMMKRWKMS